MIRRRDEWSERLSALVLLVACILLGCAYRVRVADTQAALDRRERQIDELVAWSRRAAGGAAGVAPDLAGLFGDGFEVMAAPSPERPQLRIRAAEVSR